MKIRNPPNQVSAKPSPPHIDFAGSTIHVRANYTHCAEGLPKSGKVRAVPLVDLVAAKLDALSRREHFTEPGNLIFCNRIGTYLHDGELRHRFYEALNDADLGHKRDGDRPITFHDLRHTFGTLAVKAWDLPKVQGYMGHADISTTMVYVHHVPKTEDAEALQAQLLEVNGMPLKRPRRKPAEPIPALRTASDAISRG